jgi:type VI secretion system secreted protein VgrG
VIVDFLEGDPDRPIITGSVYNAEQMPPYTLPNNRTQSGVKSRSSLQGSDANFNEIRFEDKKGAEQIYIHAEKNYDVVIENNETRKVGFDDKDKGDQTVEIYNDAALTVGRDRKKHVKRDETTNVDQDRTETVKRNEKITVNGTRTETVEGDETITLNAKRTTKVKKDESLEVTEGNQKIQIKKGNREIIVDMGNVTTTVKMGNMTTKMNLGKSTTEAMQSIELKVGQSSIKLDQTGVTIKGMMVKVEGQITADVKAPMTTVNADGILTLKGSLTMIN